MYRTTVLIFVVCAVLASCVSPGNAPSDASTMPADWTLDATILAGPDADDRTPAHLRPSRYTVFPDGSLHYADADEDAFGRGTAWLPPRTRILPAAEVAGVWALARELGFVDPAGGELPRNAGQIRPPADGRAIIIDASAGGTRRMFVFRSEDAEGEDRAERLVRHLAALAWADDRREDPAFVRPSRYDLGPDPYARYRNP